MFEHLNNYFTDDERSALKAGASAWGQIKKHESWSHWLAVGRAVATVLDAAAKATGQTSGKSFNTFMARAYSTPSYLGDFEDMNKAVRSVAAKCWRNREAIDKWRLTIGQDKALRMNHPSTVWSNFEAARHLPAERNGNGTGQSSTKQELAEALTRIHELEKELAKRDGGDDFTLSMRMPDDQMAEFIFGRLGPDRIDKVYRALGRKLGKKPKPQ